jgi:hypothetical protein
MAEEKTNEESLEQIENFLSKGREKWDNVIDELSGKINDELKESIELEAIAIAYRQKISSQINSFALRINKDVSRMKLMKKHYFEFYATKYQIKTNTTEKTILIDADISTLSARIDMFDSYVQYLSDCGKSIDHIIWSIKNKIQIHNILGLD